MKYEIRGTYKFILGVLALVLILSTVLFGFVSKSNRYMSTLENIISGFSILILFGASLVTFFYIVGSFRKELYEDRGYLTFTLPLTGNQIVASKLLVALLWFILLGVVVSVYYFLLVLIYSNLGIKDMIYDISQMIGQKTLMKSILFAAIASIYSLINMLVLIYFSMALGKVTFKDKKIGGLWFVIFLILSAVLTYGQYKIAQLIPYYMDLATFKIGSIDTLAREFIIETNDGIMISTNTGILNMNIASNIFSILSTIGLFLGTGYLIEKRIDL